MIEISIVGFGKLGKKVIEVSKEFPVEIRDVYTRRKKEVEKEIDLPVYSPGDLSDLNRLENKKNRVAIICNSSKTLLEQAPIFGRRINSVWTFDDHSKIVELYLKLNKIAKESKTICIFTGWDPGLFSMIRSMFATLYPKGEIITLWGYGSSRGHAEKVMEEIDWAESAVQYTNPIENIIERILKGEKIENLEPQKLHERIVFVVLKKGATKEIERKVRRKIKNIPGYFKGYKTKVFFISRKEMKKNHSSDPHGGMVIGRTFTKNGMQLSQFRLQQADNPEFTARCTLRAAIAAVNKRNKREHGACLESHVSQSECYLYPLEERGKDRNDFV